jgi:hypothetical protein
MKELQPGDLWGAPKGQGGLEKIKSVAGARCKKPQRVCAI